MFGRSNAERNDRPNPIETPGPDSDVESTAKDSLGFTVTTPQRASDLIGGSAVSLDGRSLILPVEREFDEVSSINTAQYGFADGMRILGAVEHDDDVENGDADQNTNESNQDPQHVTYEKKKYEYEASRPKSDDRTLTTGTNTTHGTHDGCLPLWITGAPMWLKAIIVASTTLLIGAIALVGVGASMAVQDKSSSRDTIPIIPNFPSAEVPSQPQAPSTNVAPVAAPVKDGPTMAPSSAPTSSTVSVFVTGGRFTGESLSDLPNQLASLPGADDNSVLFHLGDWNSPFATQCDEASYQTNVDLYKPTSIPVYFVPGDNEYNDCPDPEQALQYWEQYLVGFETKYWEEPAWNITRQDPDYSENFAYIFNGVLFVGINLVGGEVHDNREWISRQDANVEWIDEQYTSNAGSFEVMVVLAHAGPDIESNNNFYDQFYERVQKDYELQVILVNRNLGGEVWGLETQHNKIDNLMRVVAEGSIWPPLLMQIDTKAGTVDIDQFQWYEDLQNPPLPLY